MLIKKLLTYNTKGLLKSNNPPRSSMGYNKVAHVGIIFTIDSKNKHETIKGFVKQLENDGKKVEVIAYLPKKQENHEFLFDFFTEKDVSFWGKITNDKVEAFAKKAFDYLFYIDIESNMLIQNVLAMSQAKCRVAVYSEENDAFCEMMVNVPGPKNIQKLVDEMHRYTKLLS